ncbi:hypothetical protein DB30_04748 [Enhygromyxa salina]|uniref:Uncharacterized protein n=1 Tax=Enhygromyxa salina TaxID=215803 RepID=A0A0C1ZYK0_9BACT|nr:hypothetical protein DB30_04748 [Enhygromyxa salina]
MVVSSLTSALGCHRVVSGVDPGSLGYGSEQTPPATGYDSDPVPRTAPMPWTPPDRAGSGQRGPDIGMIGAELGAPSSSEPVAYTEDIIRVCKHLGGEGASAEADAACRRQHRVAQVFRPISDWKTLAACLVATTDVAGVEACKLATPPSVAPIPAHARESAVCMHVFALGIVEELGPEPMLDPARLEEFAPLLAACVDTLVNEERDQLGQRDYAAMLQCVEAASTTAAAELCAA